MSLFSPVSLQDSTFSTVNSYVGGSVTLPCRYENKLQSTDVYWRYNASRKVLSIINGKPSPEEQDKIFSNRTKSFPSEYSEGNYSVELKDLQLTHAGNYTCFIQDSNEEKKIQLFPEKQTPSQRNSCMKTESPKIFLTALLGLTLHLI
ncbi:V-set domain-containing T-cell activation inhibitor 1 [Labeo rohita]|uniref:V-set domain-containing T-cell activation inhibitor 1 n=1 Tax=Labeo rohita TaxID=84645 RepID=A0ABQ8L5Q6_LABRO|nr:V-set domain-containing T-cell activation inhibitor 1 [Labeo rohita]